MAAGLFVQSKHPPPLHVPLAALGWLVGSLSIQNTPSPLAALTVLGGLVASFPHLNILRHYLSTLTALLRVLMGTVPIQINHRP